MTPRTWSDRVLAVFASWRERKLDLAAAVAAVVLLFVYLTLQSGQGVRYNFREGDIVSEDIRAPLHIEVLDQRKTSERTARIREEVPAVFVRQPDVPAASAERLAEIVRTASREDLSREARTIALRRSMTNLAPELIEILLDKDRRGPLVERTGLLLDKVYSRGLLNAPSLPSIAGAPQIRLIDEQARRSETVAADAYLSLAGMDLFPIATEIFPSVPARDTQAAVRLAGLLLRPNLVFDIQATAALVDERLRSEGGVFTTIRKGQLLAKKGEVLSHERVALFQEISQRSRKGWSLNAWGVLLFYAVLAGLFLYGAAKFEPRIIRRRSYAYVFLLFILFYFLIVLYASRMDLLFTTELSRILFLPVIVPCLVLPVFFSAPFAAFSLTLLLVLNGFLVPGELLNQIFLFLIGFAGIALRDRFRLGGNTAFWTAGLLLLAAQIVILLVAGLVQYLALPQILRLMWFGTINAVVSVLLSFGIIALFESVFNLAIDYRLMELSNLNKPIFKRLLLEAPGTYHHSVLVANLAEAAALEIGANSLLVKIASYYHDIGKLNHPDFFIENTGFDLRAQRKEINPRLSASVVKQHLRESVEMGRKLRLPVEVLEVMGQHHGRSLIKFFYYKALNEAAEDSGEVTKEDFTYPGENPRTREAVILLLADSVEAASRSIEDPTYSRLRDTVEEIMNGKFTEGLLSESEITLGEVRRIGTAFLNILTGVFHNRIRYPADSEIEHAEESARSRNGHEDDPSER
jgi:putative nucleotidyltransferase with HDIG domain